MRVALFALGLFFSCFGQGIAAESDQPVHWKDVQGWSVYSDRSNGNACYMFSIFEGGTALRLGFNGPENPSRSYLAIGDVDWASIEDGKDYDISIRMDRESPWTATAQGMLRGEIRFLVIQNLNVDFFDEFARKLGVQFFYEGKQIAHLSLRGSYAALSEMLECQSVINEYLNTPADGDPFKNGSKAPEGDDPFL